MSFSEAASIPVCFGTSALGLLSDIGAGLNPTFDRNVKHHGQAAVVVGGSSSVGQYGKSPTRASPSHLTVSASESVFTGLRVISSACGLCHSSEARMEGTLRLF